MPRPKGSRNKKTVIMPTDFELQIAQKQAELDALNDEQKNVSAAVAEGNARLKEIKKSVLKLQKEIARIEMEKAEVETAAAIAAKKEELQATIDKLVADGTPIDAIIEKLK